MAGARLTVDGRSFDVVVTRRTGARVARGDDTWLRIGPGVDDELEVHRAMLERGYPVAPLVGYGVHEGAPYLVEQSLGPSTLGDRFSAAAGPDGKVPDDEATAFVDVIRRLARAQAGAAVPSWDLDAFARLVGVEGARVSVPQLAGSIDRAFGEAASRLDGLPGALLHADLHPYNTCAGGVIDLEGSGWGVLGYDVVTAIYVETLCDPAFDGLSAPAGFTGTVVRRYLAMLDECFGGLGVEPVATYVRDLLVCRSIALCSRRHPNPEVWQARTRVLGRLLAPDGTLPEALRPR